MTIDIDALLARADRVASALEGVDTQATKGPWGTVRVPEEDNCLACPVEHADIYHEVVPLRKEGENMYRVDAAHAEKHNVACATFSASDAEAVVAMRNRVGGAASTIRKLVAALEAAEARAAEEHRQRESFRVQCLQAEAENARLRGALNIVVADRGGNVSDIDIDALLAEVAHDLPGCPCKGGCLLCRLVIALRQEREVADWAMRQGGTRVVELEAQLADARKAMEEAREVSPYSIDGYAFVDAQMRMRRILDAALAATAKEGTE